MKNDLNEILDLMERTGGSFVRALANCYLHADPPNKAKLLEAFDGYFENYDAKVTDARSRLTPTPNQ
jgi:hypothetical protein